jgi:Phasin protein
VVIELQSEQKGQRCLGPSYSGSSGACRSPTVGVDPQLALGAWHPFLVAALKTNTWAHERLGALGSEWQCFVRSQLEQHGALIERLSHSRTSDQVVLAYTDFWQQVAESYGKEVTTLTKLMTSTTGGMVMATPSVSEDRPTQRAALAPV